MPASGEVQCASCNPTGAPPSMLRSDPPGNEAGTTSADVMASNSGRFMSDDGRVAFATADALSPRDTDGIVDVYEYIGGRPQLIGAGTGDRDVVRQARPSSIPGQVVGLESMSRDGRDIYFSTYDTLVPQDQNGAFVKFYDARTGGGFVGPGRIASLRSGGRMPRRNEPARRATRRSARAPIHRSRKRCSRRGQEEPEASTGTSATRKRHKHRHSTHRNG